MSTQPAVGLVRLNYVEGHINADASLKAQVGPRNTPVPRRDGATVNYPQFVVDVTAWIQSKEEVMHLPGAKIQDYCRDFLELQAATGGTPAPVAPVATKVVAATPPPVAKAAKVATAEPAPVPVAPVSTPDVQTPADAPADAPVVEAVAPKRRGRKPGSKNKPKTSVAPEAATSEAPSAAAPEAVPEVEPEAAAPVEPEAQAETEPEAKAEEEGVAPADKALSEKALKVNVNLSIFTLLVGCCSLVDRDMRPGKEKRKALLLQLTSAYEAVAP